MVGTPQGGDGVENGESPRHRIDLQFDEARERQRGCADRAKITSGRRTLGLGLRGGWRRIVLLDFGKKIRITRDPRVIYQNNRVCGYVGMGFGVPCPHPQYPSGAHFSPFIYPWVKLLYQTLTLTGKNPLGMRVMGAWVWVLVGEGLV